MNSDSIYTQIEAAAAVSSKKSKEAIIHGSAYDADFRRVLVAALDSSVSYYMEQIPARVTESNGHFTDYTWRILDALCTRQLSGIAALTEVALELTRLSEASAELLRRIIRKDLRAGFSASTVNKAIPGLIPVFPYMRCALPKEAKLGAWPWEDGVLSQEKADGMFANLNRPLGGPVTLTSRQGSLFPMKHFADLALEAPESLLPGTQTHGELLVCNALGEVLQRAVGNGMLNSVQQGGSFEDGCRPVYLAWDQIPLTVAKGKGKHAVPYSERWAALQLQIGGAGNHLGLIPTRVVNSFADAQSHFREVVVAGREGTIVKHPDGPWMDGTSLWQVKMKLEFEADLLMESLTPGNGKNAALFGSIVCVTSDRLLRVGVSGMSDKVRKQICEQWAQLEGRGIVSVKANSVMAPSASSEVHSLFLPRFGEIRTDKSEADSLQRVLDQFDAAAKAV